MWLLTKIIHSATTFHTGHVVSPPHKCHPVANELCCSLIVMGEGGVTAAHNVRN